AVFDYWWMFALSFLCFAGTMLLTLMKKWHGFAFVLVILQMAFAFFGYGVSKLPYILYPYIRIDEHVVNSGMAIALIIAFILCLLLLIPSLILLLNLFFFYKKYVEVKKYTNILKYSSDVYCLSYGYLIYFNYLIFGGRIWIKNMWL